MNIKYAIIITVSILALGFLLLYAAGGALISEVTTEVKIDRGEEILDAKIGSPAPYFELTDLNGQPAGPLRPSVSEASEAGARVKITDFLGKPAVIVFWASWNKESADQIKILDDFLLRTIGSSITKPGVTNFIAINSQEDKSAVSSFITRGNYNVRVLLDESGEITEKYNARSLPAAYFIDKEGVLREMFIGVMSESMLVEKIERLLAR